MVKYNLDKEKLKVCLTGDLDTKGAFYLRKELLDYINKGYHNIVVDVENLDYIDSTGLGVLVTANKLVQKTDGQVYIEGLKGHVKKIFELTRLNKVFHIGV